VGRLHNHNKQITGAQGEISVMIHLSILLFGLGGVVLTFWVKDLSNRIAILEREHGGN
jgi:hypothetical protein